MAPPRKGRPRRQPIVDLATHPQYHVTPSQLAAYWGCNLYTVYKLIKAGALPVDANITREYVIVRTVALQFEREAKLSKAKRLAS